jgi:hypothetical protein
MLITKVMVLGGMAFWEEIDYETSVLIKEAQ